MKFRKSGWIFDGSSGGDLGAVIASVGKGEIKLKKIDKGKTLETTTLTYGAAGVSMGKGLIPLDLSFSTGDMPDTGNVYISEKVSGELKSSDFDGLCFIHAASLVAQVGVSHTMLFFGIPWDMIPKQLLKARLLNFFDLKSYLLGPLYGAYQAGKLILGSGDMPNLLRPLAGEAKGVIKMIGQVVGPASFSIGASMQYGYMSSDSSVMPWETNFPTGHSDVPISYQNVSQNESIIRVPGDVLFGFDKDKVGTGTGGIVKAEATLFVVAYSLGLIRPRTTYTEGHTDLVGSPAYNLDLSKRRAEAVKAWLLTKGKLKGLPITALGFGLTKPVADNRTDDGRAKNRRVEFRIYG